VNKNYKLLTNNVLKRLKLLVKVISEEENTSALGLISRAKSLATKRTKILFTIMRYLVSPTNSFDENQYIQLHKVCELGFSVVTNCTHSYNQYIDGR